MKMKRTLRIICLIMALMLVFTAVPLTAGAAAATTKKYTAAELSKLSSDVSGYFMSQMKPQYTLSKDVSKSTDRLWSRVISNKSYIFALQATILADMKTALKNTSIWAQKQGIIVDTDNLAVTAPSWIQIGLATVHDAKVYKSEYISCTAVVTQDTGGYLNLSLKAGGMTPYGFVLKVSGGGATKYLEYTSNYAYLNTFFNGSANAVKYSSPAKTGYLKKSGLKKLKTPLKTKKITLRRTWLAARDTSPKDTTAKLVKRYHTGTDVWAKSDTKIYSMTAGTVVAVGTESVSGNFVIVKDKYGYYWHYYHMKAVSTYVKAGQKIKAGKLIGRVGSTGNSDRTHLHVTIINGDCKFMNPYDAVKKSLKKYL